MMYSKGLNVNDVAPLDEISLDPNDNFIPGNPNSNVGSNNGSGSTNSGGNNAGTNSAGGNTGNMNAGNNNAGSSANNGSNNGANNNQNQNNNQNTTENIIVPTRPCNLSALRTRLQMHFDLGNRQANSADLVDYSYCLFYGRQYDVNGRGYWRFRISGQGGVSRAQLISQTYNSPEFKRKIDTMSNAAFLNYVYTNILARVPDSAGYNYWFSELQTKNNRMAIVANFTQTNEFLNAYDIADRARQGTTFLYKRILGRTDRVNFADEGVGYWDGSRDVFDDGGRPMNTSNFVLAFTNSTEFTNVFLNRSYRLSAKGMVELAYRFYLQRAPEQAGLNYWIRDFKMRAGEKTVYTQEDFIRHLAPHFVASDEFNRSNPWYNSMPALWDY